MSFKPFAFIGLRSGLGGWSDLAVLVPSSSPGACLLRAANILLRLSHVWVAWSPMGSCRSNHFHSCKFLGQLKCYQYLLQSFVCTGAMGDGSGEYLEWVPSTTLGNPRKRQSVTLCKYHQHQITSGSSDSWKLERCSRCPRRCPVQVLVVPVLHVQRSAWHCHEKGKCKIRMIEHCLSGRGSNLWITLYNVIFLTWNIV